LEWMEEHGVADPRAEVLKIARDMAAGQDDAARVANELIDTVE
jgi:hypothetical protein